MTKKTYVEVLRLVKGKGFDSLGVFETPAIANWHIANTFADKYVGDKLVTKKVQAKGVKPTPKDIAEDKGAYVLVEAAMDVLDWDSVSYTVTHSTLLGLLLDGEIATAKTIGRLGKAEVSETVATIRVPLAETDAIPYSKINKDLESAVLGTIVGEDEEDETEEEPEEEKEEEKVKEPAKTVKPKKKPEPPVEEEDEDEDEEDTEDEEDSDDEDEDSDDEDEDSDDEDSDDEDDDSDDEDSDDEDDDSDDEDSDDEDDEDEDGDEDSDEDDEDDEDEDDDDEDELPESMLNELDGLDL